MKTQAAINSNFNTIETICNTPNANKTAAYLAACDMFELQASQFINTKSFMCRMSSQEVSNAYAKAKLATCEYSTYVAAIACEVWLSKAFIAKDNI
jgi:hypothetical protein